MQSFLIDCNGGIYRYKNMRAVIKQKITLIKRDSCRGPEEF